MDCNHLTGCCEHGNEPSGSVKCGLFRDQSNDCQFLSRYIAHFLLSSTAAHRVWRQTLTTHTAVANRRLDAAVVCGRQSACNKNTLGSQLIFWILPQPQHSSSYFPCKASLKHTSFEVFPRVGTPITVSGPSKQNNSASPPDQRGAAKTFYTKSEIFCVIAPSYMIFL